MKVITTVEISDDPEYCGDCNFLESTNFNVDIEAFCNLFDCIDLKIKDGAYNKCHRCSKCLKLTEDQKERSYLYAAHIDVTTNVRHIKHQSNLYKDIEHARNHILRIESDIKNRLDIDERIITKNSSVLKHLIMD